DPTIAAIACALQQPDVQLEDIVVITIGTGYMESWIASDSHNWGANQWTAGDDNPFTATPAFFINLNGQTPALDLTLNGTSTNLTPELVRLMLGDDRYVNINPQLPCFIPENSTSPQDLALLEKAGEEADLLHSDVLLAQYWRTGAAA
ncbi:MAG TPA: hypothetical protein VFZ89_05810, partial [Solirubrobacteraceae bacterium]